MISRIVRTNEAGVKHPQTERETDVGVSLFKQTVILL